MRRGEYDEAQLEAQLNKRGSMNAAYGWAFARPVRKVFCNVTITSVSIAVALIIGTIELIGVFADQAHITSGPSRRSRPSRWTTLATASSRSSSPPRSPLSVSGTSEGSRSAGRPISRGDSPQGLCKAEPRGWRLNRLARAVPREVGGT